MDFSPIDFKGVQDGDCKEQILIKAISLVSNFC